MVHIKGILVLRITVDPGGEIDCVEYVSGHPLIIGVALASVRKWKFRPLIVKGQKQNFTGRIVLKYDAMNTL
jgi:outer membrane biosynthesis protein TonB